MRLLLAVLSAVVFPFTCHATLNFDEALSAIMNRSPEIPTSKSNLISSKSSLLSQKLQILPTLSTGWSKSETFENPTERSGLFVKSTLNLFRGGSHFSSYKSDKYDFQAAKAGLDQTTLTVEEAAVRTLLNYVQRAKDKDVFEKLLAITQESLKTTQLRFKKGLLSEQEVIRSQVDVGIAKASFKTATIDLNNARAELTALLGHSNVVIDWPWKIKLSQMNSSSIRNKQIKIDLRPDVKEARYRVLRDSHTVDSIKGNFLPRVDLSYTFSRDEIQGTELDERTSLLSVSFPLFEGWATVASVRESQVVLAGSRQVMTTRERTALSESESAKANLIESIETAKERQINMQLARKLYRISFKSFQQGRSSVNDIQTEQSRFLNSESQSNSGWTQAHLAWLNFCHALGERLYECTL